MDGGPLPSFSHLPELLPGAEQFLDAFWHLSADRQIGMQAGPIPSASIDRWADRNGLDPDEHLLFTHCIRAMDAEWLSRAAEISGKERPDKPKQPARKMSTALFDAIFGVTHDD